MIEWGFGNLNGSLEQVQVKLLEKQIYRGLKVSIIQYSMVLFWTNNDKGMFSTASPFAMIFMFI